MVDASKSQVFERSFTKRVDETLARVSRIEIAPRDAFEEILKLFV